MLNQVIFWKIAKKYIILFNFDEIIRGFNEIMRGFDELIRVFDELIRRAIRSLLLVKAVLW